VVPRSIQQKSVFTPELSGGKKREATMGDELELAADKHVRYIVTVEKVTRPASCVENSSPAPTTSLCRRTRSSRW
jgi:hypothetical protein